MFSGGSCLAVTPGAYLLRHILGHQPSNQLGTMLLPLDPNPTVYCAHRVQELTRRSRNLDAEVIVKLNRVIQGTANYFATRWSTNRRHFRLLDCWVRRRLRCMKFKRFSYHHNRRMRLKQFVQLGLLSLESFCGS
jgi:hypothetical protein